MYDIFVIGNNLNWKKIKSKYPFAKKVSDFKEAKSKAITPMFWAVWDDIEVQEDFDFTLSVPKWDEDYVHVWKNKEYFDGLSLIPKNKQISDKEVKYRFFTDKKEIDQIASEPKKYDIFEVETYEQYLEAMEKSTTDMFWMTSPNLKIAEDFKFDLYITHHNAYERQENHAFVHLVNGEKLYNGIFLMSKKKPVTKREIEHRYIIDRKEWDIVASGPCQYDIFEIETYEQYLEAMKLSKTEMFWMTSPNLKIADDFKFDIYFSHDQTYNRYENHVFVHKVNDTTLYNGVFLLSKFKEVSKREIEHRYVFERKEWDIVASGPCQYEKFIVDTYEQYLEAMSQSRTEMFWMIPSDINPLDDFNFDIYYSHDKEFERNNHHAFLNGVFYDGIFLVSKHLEISQREIESKFITNRKEEEIVASLPVKFDVFYINSYQDYLEACEQARTKMFWCVWPDVEVVDDFDFEYYVPRYNQHITHVFKNDKYFDGICLFNKHTLVSEKEFKYRFFTDKKEIDYVISYPKQYDIFEVETYEQYLEAMEKSTTDMFWMTSPNLKVADDFKFDLYITYHNSYERQENHAFAHLVNGEKLYNGIFLLSKQKPVGRKEIEHRYILERKEWDEVASGPCQYEKFTVDSYEDYVNAVKQSKTEMFWMVPSDIEILPDFKFDLYYTHDKEFERNNHHAFLNGGFYDGVFLVSKHQEISQREIEGKFITNRKEEEVIASSPVKFDKFDIATYQDYLNAVEQSSTNMFWCVWPDVEVVEDFEFDYYVPRYNQHITHIFKNDKYFDGICLFNKNSIVSEKEFKYRFFSEKKEIDYVISYPKKCDVFEIETYEQYLEAMETSKTDMFWMTSPNLKVADNFNFDVQCSRFENHAFAHLVNGEKLYNGIFLLSKHRPVGRKEIEHRYILERKEWDIVASGPCQYEKFIVDNYEDYLHAVNTSKTEMFYMIPSDIEIMPDFKFDLYYTHDKEFERNNHHGLINGGFYDGIFLVSKRKEISKKEIDGKFVVDRKEEEIFASRPVKFDKFDITTYQDYLEACERSKTNMFWCVWTDLTVVEDFDFEYYVPRYNQHITHVFKNDKYFDGVCLFNKHNKVSEKEFNYRFFSEKKEIDYVISYPKKYDIFKINTYQQYIDAMKQSKTEMFWMVPDEVEVLPNFKFDVYFSYHNTYERRTNHSFKHLFRGEETYNGICLMSKHVPVSEKEITFRYLVERKEWEVVASKMKPYDVVFISYNEINADENFERVKSMYPDVKRVHGVKGIHQAHIKAAEQATTENFWVVDGDAVIADEFKFDYEIPIWERDTVHVWRSQNPINNLVYGYGGVKLLPRQLTLDMDVTRPDMTTSISNKFKPVQVISNITAFNTDEFSTWKSAFRECAKLAGKAIDRQVDSETEERLNVWCTEGADKPYGEFAIKGALAGRKFATEYPEDLFKINDFDWLYEQYEKDIRK